MKSSHSAIARAVRQLRSPRRREDHHRIAASRRRALSLEALEQRQAPAVDLTLIGPGLAGSAFATLQDRVDSQVLSRPVFLLGDQLGTADATRIMDRLSDRLSGLTIGSNSIDAVKQALDARLGGWIRGRNQGGIQVQGTPDSDLVTFQLTLDVSEAHPASLDLIVDPTQGTNSGSDATFRIDGMKTGGTTDNADLFDAQVRWSMPLTFGVDAGGFFLRTSTADELTLDLEATLKPGSQAMGRLGILPATFKADPDAPTKFTGVYRVDVTEPSGDNLLRIAEFAQIGAVGRLGGRDINGDGVADAPARSEFHMQASGGFLPSVIDPSEYEVAGLNLGYFFNLKFDSDLSYAVTYANADPSAATFGNGTDVRFGGLRMDVSPFFTDYIQPIILKLQDYFEPFKQIIDVLENPIPVVGEYLAVLDGGTAPKVKDLIKLAMQADGKGAQWEQFDRVLTFVHKVLHFDASGLARELVGNTDEDLGDYYTSPGRVIDAVRTQRVNPEVVKNLQDQNKVGERAARFMKDFEGDFSFPLLEDPSNALRLILGDPNVTLFSFDFTASAGIHLEKFFPLFYGLGIKLSGGIDFRLNVGAGFDTKGLSTFLAKLDFSDSDLLLQGVKDHSKDLMKGFYLDDHNPVGADGTTVARDGKPGDGREAEVSFSLNIGPGFGVDAGIFEFVVAVTGGVTATIGLDLNDLPENPDSPEAEYEYDGRVRLDELQTELAYNPLSIFNANGDLTGNLKFSVEIKAGGFTLVDKEYTLFETTILTFDLYTWSDYKIINGIGAIKPPPLANLNVAGDLQLNTNVDWDGDGSPDVNDKLQVFVLGQNPDGTYDVEVRRNYGQQREEYRGVRNIIADGGAGNDDLTVYVAEVDRKTGLPLIFTGMVTLNGGAGNDRLITRGGGAGLLDGGDGDDFLSGGSGADRINGGAGKDLLEGNDGDDLLDGGDGDDNLLGGSGNDTLSGGAGNDDLDGGAGNATLDGGAGDDNFTWRVNDGNATIVGGGTIFGDSLSILGAQILLAGNSSKDAALIGRNDDISIGKAGTQVVVRSAIDGTSLTISSVASLNLSLGDGSDVVTINDLKGSSVTSVNLDLKAPKNLQGDTTGDTIIVNLSEVADAFGVAAAQGVLAHNTGVENTQNTSIALLQMSLAGGITMQVQNADRNRDALVIHGNGGDDSLTIAAGAGAMDPSTLIAITLDGGGDNDTLASAGVGGVRLFGGSGNDTITSGYGPDILDAGVGDDVLTGHVGNISIVGGGGRDSLLFDDSARPGSSTARAAYTLTNGGVTVRHPLAPARTTAFSGIESFTLGLQRVAGDATPVLGNDVSILSTIAGTTLIRLSDRGDSVQVGSMVGTSGGTLAGIAGPIEIQGGVGADRLVLDAGGTAADLASARLANGSVSGLGGVDAVVHSKVERLDIRLGQGSDTLTATGSGADLTTIDGGPGVDRMIVELQAEANSLAASPFRPLGLAVETLRILEKAGASTQATGWMLSNGLVYAGPTTQASRLLLLDSLGAGRVVFAGEANDTLAVRNDTSGPQRATIEGGSIVVDQGAQILDFAAALADDQLTQGNAVDGLAHGIDRARIERIASVAAGDRLDVYVVSEEDNSISAFRYDPATGTMRFLQVVKDGDRQWGLDVDGLRSAPGVVVSQDGLYVDVAGRGDNAVASFARDPVTGQLRYLGSSRGGFSGPVSLVVNPVSPSYVYAAVAEGLQVFRRNASGILEPVATSSMPEASPVGGIAISPDGRAIYVMVQVRNAATRAISAFLITPSSPGTVLRASWLDIASFNAQKLGDATSLAISADGTSLYAIGRKTNDLVIFRRSVEESSLGIAGAFSPSEGFVPASLDGVEEVVLGPDGRDLYVASPKGHTFSLYRRDAASGKLLLIETYDTFAGRQANAISRTLSVAISPDGLYVATAGDYTPQGGNSATSEARLYYRDPISGRLKLVSTGGLIGSGGAADVAFSVDSKILYAAGGNSFFLNAFEIAGVGEAARLTHQGSLKFNTDVQKVLPVAFTSGSNAQGIVYVLLTNGSLTLVRATIGENTAVSLSPTASYSGNYTTGAFDASGRYYYGVANDRRTIRIYKVDDAGVPSVFVDSVTLIKANILDLAVSDDGLYLYATRTGGLLTILARDTTTGRLVETSNGYQDGQDGFNSLDGLTGVASSPDGRFVYLAGSEDDALTVAQRDGAGKLTPVQILIKDLVNKEFTTGMSGTSIANTVAVTPDDKLVIVGTTGGAQVIFARDADGSLFYVNSVAGLPDASGTAILQTDPKTWQVLVVGNATSNQAGQLGVLSLGATAKGLVPTVREAMTDGESLAPSILREFRHVAVVGDWVYALSPIDHSLAVFKQGPNGLTLLQVLRDDLGGIDGLASALSLAADAKGVYVTSKVDNSVTVFERQPDGSLRILQRFSLTYNATAIAATRVAISPDGKRVYFLTDARVAPIAWAARLVGTGALGAVNYFAPGPQVTSLLDGGVDLAFSTPGRLLPGGGTDGAFLFVATAGGSGLVALGLGTDGTPTFSDFVKLNDSSVKPTALALSPDGMHLYLADGGGTVWIFARTAASPGGPLGRLSASGKVANGQDGATGLAQPTDLIVSPDGKSVIVAGGGGNALAAFVRDADPLSATFGQLTFGQVVREGTDGASGLTRPTALALGDGGVLFVASAGDGGTIKPGLSRFSVRSYPSNVALSGSASQSGTAGRNTADRAVDGRLDTISATPDGTNSSWQVDLKGTFNLSSIVLHSPSDAAFSLSNFRVTLFVLDAGNQYVEILRRDFAEAVPPGSALTLALPDGSVASRVRVEYLGKNNDGSGVLALAEVEVIASGRPVRRDVGFEGIRSVSLQTGGGSDAVTIRDTPATVSVATGAGSDTVAIARSAAPSTRAIDIDLGDGADAIDILSLSENQVLAVNGGRGDDALNLWSASKGSKLKLNGGDGDDRFLIAATRLEKSADIEVDGNNHTGSIEADILAYDVQGKEYTHDLPSRTLQVSGQAKVRYLNLTPQILNAPSETPTSALLIAKIVDPGSVREGSSLTLDGRSSKVPAGQAATYSWDLDGDGSFGDADGALLNLPWSTLATFGLGDGYAGASRTVALKVSLADGRFDVATWQVAIENDDPTIRSIAVASVDGGPIVAGTAVSFTVEATDPAGSLDPLLYEFDFNNDGTFEVSSNSPVVAYAFPAAGAGQVTKTVRYRVSDGDGGFSPTKTVNVVVDDSPKIRAITPGAPGVEGSAYSLNLRAGGPKTATIARWTIAWGDGQVDTYAGDATQAAHVYRDDGSYEIVATVEDDDGPMTLPTLAASISNVAPALVASGPARASEGSPYTLSLSASDPGTDRITYWTINWGDDVVETFAGETASATHVYARSRPAAYLITVSATDEDGTYTLPSSLAVTVEDVAPIVELAGASSVLEGSPFALSLSYQPDPGSDRPIAVEVDWGDGVVETFASTDGTPFAPPTRLLHTYADDSPAGGFTVRVAVVDADGRHDDVGRVFTPAMDGIRTASLSVQVRNVAPTILPAGPATVDEGSPYLLTLPRPSDPGADTVVTYLIHWGDGTTTRAEQPGAYAHAYPAGSATYEVSVDLSDEDGTWIAAGRTSVQVRDVPPTIQLVGAARVDEGSPYALTLGPVTDPGLPGHPPVSAYIVHWGDGSVETFTSAGVKTHAFPEGPFAQTIVVDLVSGGMTYRGAGRLSVLVENVAPGLPTIAGLPNSATPGRMLTATASAVDPGGVNDPIRYAWVVKLGSEIVASGAGSSFQFTPSLRGAYTFVVTASDDDGGQATAQQTVAVQNAPSQARPFTLAGSEDATLAFPAGVFAAAVTDEDGDPLVAVLIESLPAHGTLRLGGQAVAVGQVIAAGSLGSLSFVPDADWNGTTSFFWRAGDDVEWSAASASATLSIASVNDAPDGNPDQFAATAGVLLTGSVLANDSDDHGGAPGENNGPLRVELLSGPDHASAFALAADGTFTYRAPVDYAGSDRFTYRAIDSLGGVGLPIVVTIAVKAPAENPPGITVDGNTLVITGADTSDYVSITPATPDATGATGVVVQAVLNNQWYSLTFARPFGSIRAVLRGGSDQFMMAGSLAIPAVVLAGEGSDYVVTGRGDDEVTAGSGNDQIFTGAGDDTIAAGGGNNYIDMGDGNNRVTAGPGNDQIRAGVGYDVVEVGDGNNSVVVGDGGSRITAGSGNDWIQAGSGSDVVAAGGGNNTIVLGAGNDVLSAGDGNDYIDAGEGDDVVAAGGGNNTIALGAGNDVASAGAGNDYIDGGDGDDVIDAGDGNNTVLAGSGDDVVTSGSGTDYLDGGDGNDVLLGGAGRDTLMGGRGNDLLAGGFGADAIYGGEGNDILVDGEIKLASSSDSLANVLKAWDAALDSSYTLLRSRFVVTYDPNDKDELMGGVGIDWFWTNDAIDRSDRTAAERKG